MSEVACTPKVGQHHPRSQANRGFGLDSARLACEPRARPDRCAWLLVVGFRDGELWGSLKKLKTMVGSMSRPELMENGLLGRGQITDVKQTGNDV